MNHHPELSPDVGALLEAAAQPEIPMIDHPVVRRLSRHFGKEWVNFLWHYRRRSPLLFQYMMWGEYAGWFFDPKCIRRKVARLEEWIDNAKRDFQIGPMRFFFECSIDPTNKKKHWRAPNTSIKRVQEQSAKLREGIFDPRVTERDLDVGLWLAMDELFAQFKGQVLLFFAMDFGVRIGFAYGKPTEFVRYDISYVARQYHAYPVTATEARKHGIVNLAACGFDFRL